MGGGFLTIDNTRKPLADKAMRARVKSQCIFIESAFETATLALSMNNEQREGCAGVGEFDSPVAS